MPLVARDTPGALVGLDDHDLGMAVENTQRGGMNMKPAKPAAQRFVLVRCQFLIAEENHEMLEKRIPNLPKLSIGQRSRQIDSFDLGADRGRKPAN